MDNDKAKWLAELLSLSAEEKDKAIVNLVETIDRLEDADADAQAVIDQMVEDIKEETAYSRALERSEEVRSANVDGLIAEMGDLLKSENIGKAGETLGTFQTMMMDAGIPMRSAATPKVTEFLTSTYVEEKRLPEDSRRHVQSYVSMFARITGDKPLGQYRRADIVSYVRTLEKLGASVGKSPKDNDLTVDQLLKRARGRPTMSETTVKKHVQHVKAFFKTARKHHNFAAVSDVDELFDGVELSSSVPKPRKRKSWTIAQLNALFATPIWAGTASQALEFTKRHKAGRWVYRDAYWWLPVAALWTGARLEELAQLRHEDLKRDRNGIPFLHIHGEDGRRVKTASSVRSIPVHPDLVRFGFLDLFDPTKPGKRIWPELVPGGRMGKFGDGFSTHFTDYRRNCGLYERLLDFHSLRRTFITTMRTRAKIDPLTVAALAGHDEELPIFERVAMTDGYTDYELGPLAEAVAALHYEGLDLAQFLPGWPGAEPGPPPLRKKPTRGRDGSDIKASPKSP